MTDRILARYRIEAPTKEAAEAVASAAAVEQTIECPLELVQGTWIADTIVGRVETLSEKEHAVWDASISYDPLCCGGEMTELLNMLFGNTSLQPGIRLESFTLPAALYEFYKGPRFGIEGLRRLTGVERGPLLMSAVKPMGRSAEELARMVYDLALGGCPLIKDDHSLYNQSWAPFEDRVAACAEAVAAANRKTGGKSLYIANTSADGSHFLERSYKAKELGAGGIMASPGLIGFSLIRELTADDDFGLPVFLHPCFAGGQVLSQDHGYAPECWYGAFSRLAGADAVIFTSFGGRFSFSPALCRSIAESIRTPMGPLAPAFPIPSGGMKWQLFRDMYHLYGDDAIFLVGGALQTEGPSLTENTRFFLKKLKEAQE